MGLMKGYLTLHWMQITLKCRPMTMVGALTPPLHRILTLNIYIYIYVTFGVYIQFPPYSSVSAAFWATLKGDTLYVVMTVA